MRGVRSQGCCVLLYALLGSVALTTAATSNETQSPSLTGQNSTGSDDSNKDITVRKSGLRFFDTVVGTGDSPVPGEIVTVHYVARWASIDQEITRENYDNWTVFDSTRDVEDHRTPFTFTVGTNRVTPGMNEAVDSMHVGTRRIAIVPPRLGYGHLKIGIVPANSTLIYDIELLKVKGLDTRPPMGQGDGSDDYNGATYEYYDYDASDYSSYSRQNNQNIGDIDDYDYGTSTNALVEGVEDILRNYTQQLDAALNMQSGTTAKGATWVVEILAILAIAAMVYISGHWLYSNYQTKARFKRLRQEYLDSEHGGDLELEDI